MTDRELMQQALYAFERSNMAGDREWNLKLAMESIRARLSAPEPKPVAWIVSNSEYDDEFVNNPSALAGRHHRGGNPTPVYTAPPQREWQGLTDEEIDALDCISDEPHWDEVKKFARAIEAKLREKNS